MAQQTSPDDLLALKKRARRRLVGAIALVLIAVIVLWNVLDGEPKSANQQVNIQAVEIVSDAPQLKSTEPAEALKARPSPLEGADKTTDDHAAPLSPVAKPTTQVEKSPSAVAEPPEAVPPTKPPVAKPAEAEKPAVNHAQPKPETKPQALPETKRTNDKVAEADKKAADKPAAAPVKADPKGSVAIQIAALSEEAKAKSLATKLSTAGVPAYAEAKGPLTRVRAGPFASREQAEKALAKLQALGYNGVIVPK